MSDDDPCSGRYPDEKLTTIYPGQQARVSKDYPFHESYRGAVVTIRRFFDDESVAVVVDDGAEQGSILILEPRYLVRFS